MVADDRSRHRLLEDLKIEETGAARGLPEAVEQLLHTFWGDVAADPLLAKLAAVLDICDDFDRFFVAEPLARSKRGIDLATSVETRFSFAS
jgi:hypothetical protein